MEFVAQANRFSRPRETAARTFRRDGAGPGMPYATMWAGVVTTASGGVAWISETTWNGSGGGVSGYGAWPDWSAGVSMFRQPGLDGQPGIIRRGDGRDGSSGGISRMARVRRGRHERVIAAVGGFNGRWSPTSVAQTGATGRVLNTAHLYLGKGPFPPTRTRCMTSPPANTFNSKNP